MNILGKMIQEVLDLVYILCFQFLFQVTPQWVCSVWHCSPSLPTGIFKIHGAVKFPRTTRYREIKWNAHTYTSYFQIMRRMWGRQGRLCRQRWVQCERPKKSLVDLIGLAGWYQGFSPAVNWGRALQVGTWRSSFQGQSEFGILEDQIKEPENLKTRHREGEKFERKSQTFKRQVWFWAY